MNAREYVLGYRNYLTNVKKTHGMGRTALFTQVIARLVQICPNV